MPSDSDLHTLARTSEVQDFKHLSSVAENALLTQLRRFSEQAIGAFAPKTRQAWHHDSQVFSTWCAAQGRCALPASPQTIAEFLKAMARPVDHEGFGRATSTVARYHATLTWMHRAAGIEEKYNPCVDTEVVLALRSIKRRPNVTRGQKDPLTWDIIARALAAGDTRLRDRFDAALVCVGYDAMARSEDLRHMHVEHLAFNRTSCVQCGRHGRGHCSARQNRSRR